MDTRSFETLFKTITATDSIVGLVFLFGGLFLGLLGASFLRLGLGITAFCAVFWLVMRFKDLFGQYVYYIAPIGGLLCGFLASYLVDLGIYAAAAGCGYLGGCVARDIIFDSIHSPEYYYKFIPIATSLLACIAVFFLKKKLLIFITAICGSILVYHGALILAVLISKDKGLTRDVIVKPICITLFALLFCIFQCKRQRRKKDDEK